MDKTGYKHLTRTTFPDTDKLTLVKLRDLLNSIDKDCSESCPFCEGHAPCEFGMARRSVRADVKMLLDK